MALFKKKQEDLEGRKAEALKILRDVEEKQKIRETRVEEVKIEPKKKEEKKVEEEINPLEEYLKLYTQLEAERMNILLSIVSRLNNIEEKIK